ncbi:MAG: tRNA (guanosine(37)-N1)-methyltransferase TrmD [Patescibacteria group bacterium]|nr:tRNA (guanosine(37)-N1)-methyltransferase TrmD [Patescibacteria group bacterium]
MTFHIISLFPEAFDSYLEESIIGRAIGKKKIKVKFYNPRDSLKASASGYKATDDKPYGGGPGMVMLAEPILRAALRAKSNIKKSRSKEVKVETIIFSPGGKQFTNTLGRQWAKKYDHLILICGRYEGIDDRVRKILEAQEISIGDYVLTGGELPAMVVLDAMSRQIPGVLGKLESVEEGRVSSHEVYTRPEVLEWPPKMAQGKQKKYQVPKVLLSGHHAKINKWRGGK